VNPKLNREYVERTEDVLNLMETQRRRRNDPSSDTAQRRRLRESL